MSDSHRSIIEENDLPPETFVISRAQSWMCSILFLLVLTLPPLWRDLQEMRKGDSGWIPVQEFWKTLTSSDSRPLADRLREFETDIDEAEWVQTPRQWVQQLKLHAFSEGNHKVLPGREGWLFYRPQIAAMTGYGPARPEPHSVSKDPSLADWQSPIPIITAFAAELKERGLRLILLPVPMKEGVCPQFFCGGNFPQPIRPPEQEATYEMLRAAGVEVLDLTDSFFQLGQSHLKQDTHWTPAAMHLAAEAAARKIQPTLTSSPPPSLLQRSSKGDLWLMLDLPGGPSESIELSQFADSMDSDENSEVTVLGDSFINIFDDPGLGFEAEGEARIRAGFSAHLSSLLGTSVDTIAVNGGGASTARQIFARRPDDAVRKKKVVLWVLAERDLFLPRAQARQNRVQWEPVKWNPASSAAPTPSVIDGIAITARLLEKSKIPDPKTATYRRLIYCAKYKVITTTPAGPPAGAEIHVFHWAFDNSQWKPTGRLETGRIYNLTLTDWNTRADLQKITLSDDFQELETWFSEDADAANNPN